MRWPDKYSRVRAQSFYRVKSGFLFLPKWVAGEWRWLERAKWDQEYRISYEFSGWANVSWIDD